MFVDPDTDSDPERNSFPSTHKADLIQLSPPATVCPFTDRSDPRFVNPLLERAFPIITLGPLNDATLETKRLSRTDTFWLKTELAQVESGTVKIT
jgi:hypothetical protein